MKHAWYLVKRNWQQTAIRSPEFAGVGGDVWPLDAVGDRNAKNVHAAMLASRKHVQAGGWAELLCTDPSVAEAYWHETQRCFGDAWLLEVTAGHLESGIGAGVDLGSPSGGFSLIETELILQAIPGPSLNKWGLLADVTEALSYMEARKTNEALEEIDGVVAMAVRVLHASGWIRGQ